MVYNIDKLTKDFYQYDIAEQFDESKWRKMDNVRCKQSYGRKKINNSYYLTKDQCATVCDKNNQAYFGGKCNKTGDKCWCKCVTGR